MSKESNERKSKTLGMLHGTAIQRLRKQILFQLVKETKKDICFRCNEKITNINELSIDHKQPWEGRSAELFWDLDNIAFSHLSCNCRAGAKVPRTRPTGLDGTRWCSKHKDFVPSFEFDNLYKEKAYWCKKCKRKNDIRPNHAKKLML